MQKRESPKKEPFHVVMELIFLALAILFTICGMYQLDLL